jgi:hypothetical protein
VACVAQSVVEVVMVGGGEWRGDDGLNGGGEGASERSERMRRFFAEYQRSRSEHLPLGPSFRFGPPFLREEERRAYSKPRRTGKEGVMGPTVGPTPRQLGRVRGPTA